MSFQVVLVVKNQPANAGDITYTDITYTDSVPGSRRAPGGRYGHPLQYSYLQNPTERGVWQATVPKVTESDTTEAI